MRFKQELRSKICAVPLAVMLLVHAEALPGVSHITLLAVPCNCLVEERINGGRHVRPLLAIGSPSVPTLHVLVIEDPLRPRPTSRSLLQAAHHLAGVGGMHPVVPRRRREQHSRQLSARRCSSRNPVIGRDALPQHVARRTEHGARYHGCRSCGDVCCIPFHC